MPVIRLLVKLVVLQVQLTPPVFNRNKHRQDLEGDADVVAEMRVVYILCHLPVLLAVVLQFE